MGKYLTQEEFISKATVVHGDKYDYSKTIYIGSMDKVVITCPIHGDFLQTPNRHLSGCNCPQCAKEQRTEKQRITKTEFIQKARKIHNNKYDYSKVEYIDYTTKVCIVCPIHGEFWQKPNAHIKGRGCFYCTRIKKVGVCDMTHVSELKSHTVWQGMIERCYLSHRPRNASYKNCYICEDWLTFSNFHKWFYNPQNGYIDGYDIDKDLLVKGNRIYSPETCCFLPPEINKCFIRQKKSKSNLPIGVANHSSGHYVARVSVNGKLKHLGMFNTPLEAFNAYKIAKEHIVKELAENYFKEGKITERVYNALMEYEVEITD